LRLSLTEVLELPWQGHKACIGFNGSATPSFLKRPYVVRPPMQGWVTGTIARPDNQIFIKEIGEWTPLKGYCQSRSF
jgi:hypothetical protein